MSDLEDIKCALLLDAIMRLEGENERLRDAMSDMESSYLTALESPCPDEQHCTCVPSLRKRIAELEAEIERLRGKCDELEDLLREIKESDGHWAEQWRARIRAALGEGE